MKELKTLKSFGVQYVVYEDSGFLAESVSRIYPLVKHIVFLVGLKPWKGEADNAIPPKTLQLISLLPDPEQKFVIVAKYWPTEQEERTEGLRILNSLGCEWGICIDDDEMYNRDEMLAAMEMVSTWVCTNGEPTAFMVGHMIYWKNREWAIDQVTDAMPTFFKTRPDEITFVSAKCFSMATGVYMLIPIDLIVCHHLSYVRTEQQMRSKLAHYSHAGEEAKDWFETKWLNWTEQMEDLHPNQGAPWSFKRAVMANTMPHKLELL